MCPSAQASNSDPTIQIIFAMASARLSNDAESKRESENILAWDSLVVVESEGLVWESRKVKRVRLALRVGSAESRAQARGDRSGCRGSHEREDHVDVSAYVPALCVCVGLNGSECSDWTVTSSQWKFPYQEEEESTHKPFVPETRNLRPE